MEHTLLCLLLLLSTHIYSGHFDDVDGKAVLTIHPKSSQIFSGESVTLRCNIQSGEVTDWKYTWRKDGVDSISRENQYEISEVKISDNGDYRCLGIHIDQKKHSEWSDAVRLTVTDQPQAVLSVSPQWLNPGDSVTLSCGVKESSTGKRFFWYRTVPYTAGLLSLSGRSYSVEPLSGNGTSEDSYTLIPAGPSHTGGYVCRAGRGEPVYDIQYSEPPFFWSGDPQPSVSLKIRHNRTQHYIKVSLTKL
ncbi:Fc receptor-like protein 4 [Salmo salar]|uniref:Fc receptor-like protein 4 n=1 Tax=Salmo salar TaxID=8030 RepID=A0ABM3F5F5_SALSA|nr:Fc receptor-like protein 4 [Salmo salar]